MITAAYLFSLQETDLAIDGTVARLPEIEAQLGETEELIDARQRADQWREQLRPLEEKQKGWDWEAEEVRGKAAAIENKLYGGSVRNPKELEDYQADLTSLRGRLSRREDALLEAMLELDDAEAGLKQAEAALAEVEESWKAQQASLQEARAKLEGEIEGLEAKSARQGDGMAAAGVRL